MALEDLGLDADEETVYRTLVAQPAAVPEQVARGSDLPPARADAALASLTRRGLATHHPDDGTYTAAPPAVALGAELAAHRDRLQRAELAVAELVEAYRIGSLGRAQGELVEIVEGVEAVRRRYLQLMLGATRSIDLLSTGPAHAVGPEDSEETTALARSVHMRGVIDQGFLTELGGTLHVDRSLAAGVRVRTVSEIPLKLIVCDGEVAMLPLLGKGTKVDPSLVLHGGVVNVAQALFDAVWERARPYHEPHHGIDQLDTHILRLLLAGLTDRAVAGQLGLSARTVQRRLQALMNEAGVSTRIQLGWHARHHGWA